MRLLLKLKCWLVGHETRAHQEFSRETRRVVCGCCGGDWAMNDRVRIITPWNWEFARFYEEQGHVLRPLAARPSPRESE